MEVKERKCNYTWQWDPQVYPLTWSRKWDSADVHEQGPPNRSQIVWERKKR